MKTATKKKKPRRWYPCPVSDCEYGVDNWGLFTGHWMREHSDTEGECPEKEEVLVMTSEQADNAGVTEEPGDDIAEEDALSQDTTHYGEGIPDISYESLDDDPIKRLATILDVHQVPKATRNSIVSIARLHPENSQNPTNLFYLLQAKLERRYHALIPLMLQEMSTPDVMSGLNPMMLMMGGQPPGGAPAYPWAFQPSPMMGAPGMPYPGNTQFQPQYYPQPGRQPAGAPKAEGDSLKDTLTLLTTLMKTTKELGGGSDTEVNQTLREMQKAVTDVVQASKDERNQIIAEMNKQIQSVIEDSRAKVESLKEEMHNLQVEHLSEQIQGLQHMKSEEMSEGLGSLAENIGAGVTAEMQGMREAVSGGVDKIADIIGDVIRTPGQMMGGAKPRPAEPAPKLSVADASAVMALEDEIEMLAQEITAESMGVDQFSAEGFNEMDVVEEVAE